MSFTIQSTPSNRPSPDLALHPMAPQCRVLTASSSRKSRICCGVRLLGISCLLQKTSSVAPMSFSCLRREWSSALVSSRRSLSELSTTQMTPSVCSKQLRQQERMVRCPPMSHTLSLQESQWRDLMLKPSVGEISLMSSPLNFLMIVVFPALSRPSTSRRISFSFSFAYFTIDMNPIPLYSNYIPEFAFIPFSPDHRPNQFFKFNIVTQSGWKNEIVISEIIWKIREINCFSVVIGWEIAVRLFF